MLYYLFTYLHDHFNLPGAGVFQYISFRFGMTVILSLIITTVYGGRLIGLLRKKQVGETVRSLGLEGETQKQGTPTMGGLIIIAGILLPTLLFAKLENVYIILMIIATVWMGTVGFIDDYIKVFRKNKEGLAGKFKVVGQVGLGIIIAWTMHDHPSIVTRQKVNGPIKGENIEMQQNFDGTKSYYNVEVKSTKTNIPFYKNNEFDYGKVLSVFGVPDGKYAFFVFLAFVVFII